MMDTPRKNQRRTREEWKIIVEQFSTSGLSAAVFCEQQGISYPSFAKWRSTFKAEKNQSSASFVEITPPDSNKPAPSSDWAVELCVGDHLVLRIRQPA